VLVGTERGLFLFRGGLLLVLLGVFLTLGNLVEKFFPLDDKALFTSFTGLLVFAASGFRLFSELFGASVFGLLLEDVLHKVALVLEGVTLGFQVKFVVEMLVDLFGIAVALEEMSQDARSANPKDLLGHTGIPRTTSFTIAHMTALSSCFQRFAGTESRMYGHRFTDDQTVLDEASDVLSGIGVGDLVHFIGIQPNFAFSAFQHGRSKSLLEL
jgi:hypothetical protein